MGISPMDLCLPGNEDEDANDCNDNNNNVVNKVNKVEQNHSDKVQKTTDGLSGTRNDDQHHDDDNEDNYDDDGYDNSMAIMSNLSVASETVGSEADFEIP
eukprot:TRINITY_DN779969_c0_g1_i1.p1 TRINITY_DN779969_c0_g1~~TRINITY_DN779969_c0_g1_i1.p1  ORF type:complete len:100 (-),score=33.26 TRINITY_DN779969_c0_g1_i1:239-538(-)